MRCPSFTSVGGEKEAVRLRELRAAHGVRGWNIPRGVSRGKTGAPPDGGAA